MNNKIIVNNLKYETADGTILFEGVNFTSISGDKVGLIGNNGSGKTTLLRIIQGELKPVQGNVDYRGSLYYVPQQKDCDDLVYVKDFIRKFKVAENEFSHILSTNFKYSKSLLDREISQLSGGEFILMQLSISIAINPDILLLDEPTNHLDKKGKSILENYVSNFMGILIIVTHDIAFLKRTTNRIFSIYNNIIQTFTGTYQEYLIDYQNKIGGIERKLSSLNKQKRKIEDSMKKEAARFARSKKVGKKAKNDRSMSSYEKGFFKEKSEKQHGKSVNKISKINVDLSKEIFNKKIEIPKDSTFSFVFPETFSKKSLLFKVKNGELLTDGIKLVGDINFEIYYGDRIILMGNNGVGKSLLINKILTKTIQASEYYQKNSCHIAYLDQFYEIINKNRTVLENVLIESGSIDHARKVLSLFGFYDNYSISRKASVLSGGETCRLAMAIITVKPLDLIILDEPTNNIDISTKDTLINCLSHYNGALLIISHDEDFVQQLNIKKYFEIKNNKFNEIF